jgi:cobalt-zinc-cadmium efflux system outer membrane protein
MPTHAADGSPSTVSEKITIEQAVAEATEANLDLLAGRANIAVAEARVITAGLKPNPVLSLAADHLDLLGTGFSPENGGGPAEISAQTEFVLERGGKRNHRVTAAKAETSVTRLNFLDNVRTTIFEVQSAFVDGLLARATLELAQENQASQKRIVAVNADRLAAGDIAELELIRSRLSALTYDNAVRVAELNLRSTLTDLQKLLGRTRSNPMFGIEGELRQDAEIPDLALVRKQALAHRPDLLAMREDLRRAQANFDLQLAQGKVDYSVGAEYRRQQGVNGTSNSLGFFFSVPLAVYDRNQGEIEGASRERQQIQIQIRALEAAVTSEIEIAHQRLLTARSLLQSIEEEMLQEARDVRAITEFSYKSGDATLLELLDAQNAFNETIQTYDEARAEYARALYFIESVTGTAVNP